MNGRAGVGRIAALLAGLTLGLVALISTAKALATAAPAAATSGLIIDAVHYDGQATDDLDEAVAVRNLGDAPLDLAGYALGDGGNSQGVVSGTLVVEPGQVVWLARDATAFAGQFDTPPNLQLDGWPGYSNTGDEVELKDPLGASLDVLVYGGGDATYPGWVGPALLPYSAGGNFAAEGQILYRMRDQVTGRPVPDTNTADDWAQSRTDVINGRRVRYPGWTSDEYFWTKQITATGTLTIAIAPDNSYDAVVGLIANANDRIRVAALTLENVGVGQALADAAARGVEVVVLLEGAPAGGIDDHERYVCQLIENAGGQCWFMISDDATHIHDRYRFMHAKYLVVDGQVAMISSENFSPDSMPFDDKSNGTRGRRGVILMLRAQPVATYLEEVFGRDLNPLFPDIFRWSAAHETYGSPPPGFIPDLSSGGIGYAIRFPQPNVILDTFNVELVQSPDNSLRNIDGLLGLIGRVGEGDTLLVQQLTERPFWGTADSRTALTDPNPRLDAIIAAGRRGGRVRLLLDDYFDDPREETSNAATCRAVNRVALAEHLDMICSVANPTLLGIHNKMFLAQIDGQGYVVVGSLNGTELSHKGNREMAIQIQSDAAYQYLAAMFEGDMPHVVFAPVSLSGYRGPAAHLLISEVYYDPPELDDKEFIELANPLPFAVSLAGLTVGDAVLPTDYEDVRVFPPGTALEPGGVLVVAFSATAFEEEFGFLPDLEIVDSTAEVPDMIDEPGWGDPSALLQLGNLGDEVVLRQGLEPIDVVVYGDGSFGSLVPCPLLVEPEQSLERFPGIQDTDDCPTDFRGWPFPSPGQVP